MDEDKLERIIFLYNSLIKEDQQIFSKTISVYLATDFLMDKTFLKELSLDDLKLAQLTLEGMIQARNAQKIINVPHSNHVKFGRIDTDHFN
ncbi:hypothetical protein NKT34_21030 [Paenibacillus polysaccharolyticus]|uniref:hypothetical protein n=1 Tax=Paenibacillus polysaccharolyticus TaxID=582692 RepID=UPI0012B98A8F|nr:MULTISPECIES: hypothetical protein [Paenibacillus]MCP1135788.1 hypothetical protein [Paenibacillus polysaccharolyticus]